MFNYTQQLWQDVGLEMHRLSVMRCPLPVR